MASAATNRTHAGRRWIWPAAVAGAVAVMITILALLGSPGSAGAPSLGPQGTLALRRLLQGMGARVAEAAFPPAPPASYVLPVDLRSDAQARALLAWARRGGRLVVADPSSRIDALLGVSAEGPLGGPFGQTSSASPDCAVPDTAGVRSIHVGAGDDALVDEPAAAVSCFPVGRGQFELWIPEGRGTVVLLGGFSPFTNSLLGDADNARYALGVLGAAPGSTVAFGPAAPPGLAGLSRSLWGSLPDAAKAALVGLALALLAAAAVAGRRLGRPVPEETLTPVPASELATAVAALYRRSHAVGHAGGLLRRAARDRVDHRLGLPPAVQDDVTTAAVARATGLPRDRVESILNGSEPTDDGRLIDLGKELEEMARAVESST